MRRAKIVCTLGPATSTPETIRGLVDAGMDVARMNLSHGSYADHEKVYAMVRQASDESGRSVAVLVDLQGPKIRLGNFASGPVDLAAGDVFTITTEDVPGDKDLVSTTYLGLPGDVRTGDRILIDDGKVSVEVTAVDGPRVVTRVIEGGVVSNHKGLNLPGVAMSVPALSEKDAEDLRWGLKLRADWIALSRRNAKPVIVATQVLESMIENSRPTRAEASDAANAVLDGADALMLSGETSVGKHAVTAVPALAPTIENTEDHGLERILPLGTTPRTRSGAITAAAARVGEQLDVKMLVTFTQGGDSARRMSRLRSKIPLIAFTPEPVVRSQLSLTWGVETFLAPYVKHTDDMVKQVDTLLVEEHRLEKGDAVVIVAGAPPGVPGTTNALRVHRIGDIEESHSEQG